MSVGSPFPTPEHRAGRLGIGVIGAGRVGAVLGSALRSVGHAVVGVSAVSEASRERAEMLLPGVPVLEVEELVERTELVLLAVPESELAGLVSGLAGLGRWQAGQLVVHTAGPLGVAVLAPATTVGAIPLAIHPAMTFTGTSLDLARLSGAPFAVTAAGPVLPIAQALVVELGGEPVVVDEADRPAYAEVVQRATDAVSAAALEATEALEALGIAAAGPHLTPLLTTTLDRALRRSQ